MESWEKFVIGAFIVIALFWFFPGIKPTLEQSKDAPKDWKGVLIPIALVVIFIIFLISTL